jgi:hypothetical protein
MTTVAAKKRRGSAGEAWSTATFVIVALTSGAAVALAARPVSLGISSPMVPSTSRVPTKSRSHCPAPTVTNRCTIWCESASFCRPVPPQAQRRGRFEVPRDRTGDPIRLRLELCALRSAVVVGGGGHRLLLKEIQGLRRPLVRRRPVRKGIATFERSARWDALGNVAVTELSWPFRQKIPP